MSEHRDPAVEAAQRAWMTHGYNIARSEAARVATEAAAREALAPIRELHEELSPAEGGGETCPPKTDYEQGIDYVLERLRPLIYTSEELK